MPCIVVVVELTVVTVLAEGSSAGVGIACIFEQADQVSVVGVCPAALFGSLEKAAWYRQVSGALAPFGVIIVIEAQVVGESGSSTAKPPFVEILGGVVVTKVSLVFPLDTQPTFIGGTGFKNSVDHSGTGVASVRGGLRTRFWDVSVVGDPVITE